MFAFVKIQLPLCYRRSASTTVTPVECLLLLLATMVVQGSFSAALILLSPSTITFSLDFAAKHFFAHESLATCFQLKGKQRHRKEVTA